MRIKDLLINIIFILTASHLLYSFCIFLTCYINIHESVKKDKLERKYNIKLSDTMYIKLTIKIYINREHNIDFRNIFSQLFLWQTRTANQGNKELINDIIKNKKICFIPLLSFEVSICLHSKALTLVNIKVSKILMKTNHWNN